MTKTGVAVLSITIATISAIYYVQGTEDNNAINHALPVLIALIPIVFVDRMKSSVSKRATYAFTFSTIGITFIVYTAWITDIGQFSSGSSTNGIILLFLPLYSLIVGCIASMIAIVVTIAIEFLRWRPNKSL